MAGPHPGPQRIPEVIAPSAGAGAEGGAQARLASFHLGRVARCTTQRPAARRGRPRGLRRRPCSGEPRPRRRSSMLRAGGEGLLERVPELGRNLRSGLAGEGGWRARGAARRSPRAWRPGSARHRGKGGGGLRGRRAAPPPGLARTHAFVDALNVVKVLPRALALRALDALGTLLVLRPGSLTGGVALLLQLRLRVNVVVLHHTRAAGVRSGARAEGRGAEAVLRACGRPAGPGAAARRARRVHRDKSTQTRGGRTICRRRSEGRAQARGSVGV